jgi:murein DD-endopeptidase MepM/ murein hydrolase activator NlpD
MTTDVLPEILEAQRSSFFPVLGTQFPKNTFCPLPLSLGHEKLVGHDISTYEGLDFYVNSIKKAANCAVAYGGYGEHRGIYAASSHFNDAENDRCVHLGIDLWAHAGTAVFAPLDGTIHSFQYNGNILDYGATIITEHVLENHTFYLLFGHLSLKSLENCVKNAKILRGTKIAELGNRTENGGWSPHLHLQMIVDLQGNSGDFAGVATKKNAPEMLKNCPSPAVFCGF